MGEILTVRKSFHPQPVKIMSQNVKLVLVFLAGVALAARVKALPVIGPIIPTI